MHLFSEQRDSAESILQTSKVVTVLTAAALLYTRSAGVAFFVTGALLCSKLAKIIKKAIRQERPSQFSRHKVSYGSHASTCTFFAVYITFACLKLPIHPTFPRFATFAPVVILPWTCMIAMSRVQLGHHTWPQIAAGILLGVCCAIFWFELWVNDVGGIMTTSSSVNVEFTVISLISLFWVN
ncbi:uncharacterized protein EDB93DRAFT_84458 [Suillus bovinus]|uniref:uncharacterized protein n=1 Tax=Suillus bovinus TaxID=48563 RepID=UPI001B8627A0|nr:uncharacterized protein EDB93DRAFT_84458 [Suillus bovinus]KAG2130303.1 hypothetical protein EDB93DRAFT_84458 [Suillus bovinus]